MLEREGVYGNDIARLHDRCGTCLIFQSINQQPAKVLDECLESVARAKQAAEMQLDAINALPSVYLSIP